MVLITILYLFLKIQSNYNETTGEMDLVIYVFVLIIIYSETDRYASSFFSFQGIHIKSYNYN